MTDTPFTLPASALSPTALRPACASESSVAYLAGALCLEPNDPVHCSDGSTELVVCSPDGDPTAIPPCPSSGAISVSTDGSCAMYGAPPQACSLPSSIFMAFCIFVP